MTNRIRFAVRITTATLFTALLGAIQAGLLPAVSRPVNEASQIRIISATMFTVRKTNRNTTRSTTYTHQKSVEVLPRISEYTTGMGTNGRQLFLETMRLGKPGQGLYFEEGIRADVLKAWHKQGLPYDSDLTDLFHTDRREEILPVLEPQPYPKHWPSNESELDIIRQGLDPYDESRLPGRWSQKIQEWKSRDYPVMLRVHRGIFETLGIGDWRRFSEIMYLMMDDPDFVREVMAIQSAFNYQLTDRILQDVEVDAVIFNEPISDNNNPLISPRMYEDLALTSYAPILDLVRQHGVETIIFRTYANARILIPSILNWGFNCLWACEVNVAAMDYSDIRRQYGRDLRLIGGIDTDVLRKDKNAIQHEIEDKVPPLLADGGYIPLADGRIRSDIPFDNYIYYRRLLEKVTTA